MKRKILTAVLSAIGILVLILDTKTALSGAAEGLDLCLRVVIPSLFPFFVLSMLLTSSMMGSDIPFLRPLGKLCGIPKGAESLLIVGLLGGYPVGAQTVASAHRDGHLSESAAKRMTAFCSNAGPAFLFGIAAAKFDAWWAGWALWGIQILSALTVSALLPGKPLENAKITAAVPLPVQTALRRSISVMSGVCGWIILFRVVINFLNRWILWLLPDSAEVLVTGILELTIGCCELELIENAGLRFVIAAGILSFGGVCVAMQTASVLGNLGMRSYLLGKCIQTVISLILAFFLQLMLPMGERMALPAAASSVFPVVLAIFAIVLRESEKKCSIQRKLVV